MSATRRQRMKPIELVVMAAVVAVFIGVIVLVTTREIELASIFLGVSFIVALLLLAMFALVESSDPASDPGETPVLMQERPKRPKRGDRG
jgi:predicted lysophospholipase L1 biosynthesis ABC-type transport system permease subunit